jgi:aconitate hydratase
VLPLEFLPGENAASLGLTGREVFTIDGLTHDLTPRKLLTVRARREDGTVTTFYVLCRIDSKIELEYYRHGGILPYVLRRLVQT